MSKGAQPTPVEAIPLPDSGEWTECESCGELMDTDSSDLCEACYSHHITGVAP